MSSSFQDNTVGVLCVCDMDHLVVENDLWAAFAPWSSNILSIRIVRDYTRLMTNSHAYVNFNSVANAEIACNGIQPLFLNSSYCRVIQCDDSKHNKIPRINLSDGRGIFITHLDPNIGPRVLWGYFMKFGKIMACRVAIDDFGVTRRFAYITYEFPEQAEAAIKEMNGAVIGNSAISVAYNVPKSQRVLRMSVKVISMDRNLKNDDGTENDNERPVQFPLKDQQIYKALEPYGPISSVLMPINRENKQAKDEAVVVFYNDASPNKAIGAISEIDGVPVKLTMISGTQMSNNHNSSPNNHISQFKKSTKYNGLSSQTGIPPSNASTQQNGHYKNYYDNQGYQHKFNATSERDYHVKQPNNIFVRPLYNNVTEDMLREEFGKYGKVVEAKIIYSENGVSKGYGFVKFENPDEASLAMKELNGKILWDNELCVAPALSKHRRPSHAYKNSQSISYSQMGILPTSLPAIPPYFLPASSYDGQHNPYGIPPVYGPPSTYQNMGIYYMPYELYQNTSSPLIQYQSQSPNMNELYLQHSTSTSSPIDSNESDQEETEVLGKEVYDRVINYPFVNGDRELSGVITGLILQQKHSDIRAWFNDDKLLMKRSKQALDAYNDYISKKK